LRGRLRYRGQRLLSSARSLAKVRFLEGRWCGVRRMRAVMAGIVVFMALLGCAVPASGLPLELFPSAFPEACMPRQLVFGPKDSMWFLLRGCVGGPGTEELPGDVRGVGRLPIDDPKAQLVRRLDTSPNDLTVGPEGALWFTGGTAINPAKGEVPEIGRLTAAGQLTQFPAPAQPGLYFTLSEEPKQIIAGPENDLWFIADGDGANVLARITSAGVTSQFSAPLVRNGRGETEPKPDEVPRVLARAANGNLWMGANNEGMIGLVEAGGVVRQFRVGEYGQGIVPSGEPMIGTPDGGVWFVEQRAFVQVGPEGAVLSRVSVPSVGESFTGSLATTGDDVLWVTEQDAGEVLKRVTSAGQFGELVFCSSDETPEGMAVGPEGDLWFAARTGKDFGRLDLAQVTSELERERTQVRICSAKAKPRVLRARVACESLEVISNPCAYQATVTLASVPSRVVGAGHFFTRAIREPGVLSVPLRPVVRRLLRHRRRLLLRLTLRSGARVAASRLVVLRG
jgi:streptogramin lyase